MIKKFDGIKQCIGDPDTIFIDRDSTTTILYQGNSDSRQVDMLVLRGSEVALKLAEALRNIAVQHGT